ncbi:MAG: hypothetical protein RMY63_23350 [Nostoc sp. ChiQUE01b]|nr:hypothetical protein [Nostoc sp. ChiQUE01b]MDZ8261307.1 hypothetical protein [Nostoc sp. ChiQUE01b]
MSTPSTARHFQQLLEQSGTLVPPLPWNNLEHPPNQLSLWRSYLVDNWCCRSFLLK